MIGQTVGSYRVIEQISVGGMGTIYRAEHTLIGRIAAIKVLHPELTTHRDIVNRFFNEAKATTTIKHPGIVEIFDFGYMPSGHAYIVMEFLDGMTLSERARRRGPMPEGEAAVYLRGVCSALSAAHAKGIIHRDLKPDNIFVVPDIESPVGERVKLLDFGIAKLTEPGLAGSATKTGAVMGTPTYMSPEQCKGTGDVDHRADLYAVGCMFYELVSGRPPFAALGAGELLGSHLFVAPDPVSRHAVVSPATESLIMTLLAKDPAQRVQTARELVDRLTVIAHQFTARPLATPHETSASYTAAGADEPTVAQPFVSLTPVPTPQPRVGSAPVAMPPQRVTAPMPTPAPRHARPMSTPARPMPTPASAMRTPTPTPTPIPAPLPTPKPTTLSGAASQNVAAQPDPTRTRSRAVGILVGIGIVAIGAIVTVAATSGGDDDAPKRVTPAVQPETPRPAPPAPKPDPVPAPPAAVPPPSADPVPAGSATGSGDATGRGSGSATAGSASDTASGSGSATEPPKKKKRPRPPKPTDGDPLLETDL